jgi:hypothetical protein
MWRSRTWRLAAASAKSAHAPRSGLRGELDQDTWQRPGLLFSSRPHYNLLYFAGLGVACSRRPPVHPRRPRGGCYSERQPEVQIETPASQGQFIGPIRSLTSAVAAAPNAAPRTLIIFVVCMMAVAQLKAGRLRSELKRRGSVDDRNSSRMFREHSNRLCRWVNGRPVKWKRS